ncbi:adenylate/guanylate cyclase domain-containing protein [[Phormidium] sp. ETS-05]|uniref:adenylate/guanylate cyclase domain-containing protein n=1 Tax=[Phormidium] sp. ETS-05 TaxID=222819 RepID=UPI0018EEF575|nr:adenylate/guanylate cyclase domain-containing protein [[Phormidium] sp. ETS-05]
MMNWEIPNNSKVLIVDDTPSNLEVLFDILNESGFKVLVAQDGESALERARYGQPDLILLDILMPGIDGFETCRRLKSHDTTKDIPIIFMTGLSETVDKVKGFQLGAVDYVTKPLQYEEILARVTTHLTIRHLNRRLQEQNQQFQQQAQREKLLGEIAQRIRQSLDLEEILSTTAAEVRQFLQVERVIIYKFHTDNTATVGGGKIVVESVSDPILSILQHKINAPLFSPEQIPSYKQGKIQVNADIFNAGLPEAYLDLLVQVKVRANLVVPIILNQQELTSTRLETLNLHPDQTDREGISDPQQLYGLLIAHQCSKHRHWQASEIDLLEKLSTQIGIAVQQGQLYRHLQRAEERYHSIVENAIEGIFQTTPEGKFISVNPALAKLCGYDYPGELISNIRNIATEIYVDPNRRMEFIKIIESRHAVFNFESLIYRKNGTTIWISENARAVRDASGKILYYEGTVSDITMRKLVQEALQFQREQTETLLLNILPQPIAQRLKQEESTIADHFEAVSVLFADLVGFTEFSSRKSPQELVQVLNRIFSGFDELAERHGLEKIKTIGDAYMVVAGLPIPRKDHGEAIAHMAMEMLAEMERINAEIGESLTIRIGINSGPVVAGVIGIKKFIYDLWGDTVNIASRMESTGLPGAIQVTAATKKLLSRKMRFEKRGAIFIKGRGEINTYLLLGRK